jgi:ABC-type multidrug transport system fused ATPase/permease subunit
MSDPLWKEGPVALLHELRRLIEQRSPAEVEIMAGFSAGNKKTEKRYARAQHRITSRLDADLKVVEAEFVAAQRAIEDRFEGERTVTERQAKDVRQQIAQRFAADKESAEQDLLESKWQATALFEASKNAITDQLHGVHARIDGEFHEFDNLQHEAERVLRRRWQWRKYGEAQPTLPPFDGDPARLFAATMNLAKQRLNALAAQRVGRMFEGFRPLGLLVFCWLACLYPAGNVLGWLNWTRWVPASFGFGLLATVLLCVSLYSLARVQSTRAYMALKQILAGADLARRKTLEAVKNNADRQVAGEAEKRNQQWKKLDEHHAASQARAKQRSDEELRAAEKKYPALLAELAARRDQQLEKARAQHDQRVGEISVRYQAVLDRLRKKYAQLQSNTRHVFEKQWQQMAQRWQAGMQHLQTGIAEVRQVCQQQFPPWDATSWHDWKAPTQIPAAVPFGTAEVKLARIPGGLPKDQRLVPPQTEFQLPAVLGFRDRSLLLFKSEGDGRAQAVDAVQALMLRMLTSLPPGKVRFTIIDPVGLGKNFSAFMHLADYNEQLISSRIWTDTPHVEQRLTEMTVHMEDVIQVYLRNEFPSIEEYNAFAGDLAEPYRVLVIANFPVGFSDVAVSRLVSIIASGARCGVYTLLSIDTKLRMPREFHLEDLQSQAVTLNWQDGRFGWEFPGLGNLPVQFEAPPPPEQFTEIMRAVGKQVKDASRVEVPFESVAPQPSQWWTADSRSGIDVPLGHSGATKFQNLQLGKGTSQHVLVAGKTGSGKSTLWHALIINIALRYSPDEVELYLVDFKKGVEFKAYAQADLAHARVIAIESEREFGLSVLERLDQELKRRGDLFRNLGVQDVAAYRAAEPAARMPRILLIVDEFQELFVEDDRIAQNTSLLLDRLVRQGRAFGIHILLGSQTLAGSYSLPRSTIGQMAVRIALQCSESDAHLILSEDNTAARLLTRPGEAIYNDANGLFEGNHPFQVVWLSDEKRENYLREVHEMAVQRKVAIRPAVVFEGNAAADPTRNPLLNELLSAPTWPEAVTSPKAWLGAAVAIKDPTDVEFFRQGGANLMVVGHQEETALGILVACTVSLAAQHCPVGNNGSGPGATFYVLDGTRPDSPLAGYWQQLADYLPHPFTIAGPRGTAPTLTALAEELTRREEAGHDHFPAVYLIIYDLGRFRDLRKAEDDFSFSRSDDKPASPASQFTKLLREGPALGMHVLLWCDTYNNVNRYLDRQGLRDLEMRVLFQMNPADSSNLVDSPTASLLGLHRALLYDEGQGRLEKFRPFGLPPNEWLAQVRQQFQARLAAPTAADSPAETK